MSDNWLVRKEENQLPSFDSSFSGGDNATLALTELNNAVVLARAKGLFTLADTLNQAIAIMGVRMHEQTYTALHRMVMRVLSIENPGEQAYMEEFTLKHIDDVVAAMRTNMGIAFQGSASVIRDTIPTSKPRSSGLKGWLTNR